MLVDWGHTIIQVVNSIHSYSQDIWDWLWFSCEAAHYEKSLIFVFQEFFTCINKRFILVGGLGTRLSFHGV